MKHLFLETLHGDLIPIKLLEVRNNIADIKINKTMCGYDKGETVSTHSRFLVNKTGKNKDGFIMVVTANLDNYKSNKFIVKV